MQTAVQLQVMDYLCTEKALLVEVTWVASALSQSPTPEPLTAPLEDACNKGTNETGAASVCAWIYVTQLVVIATSL